MENAKLKLEIINHTAVLTLTNPPANTFDLDSLGALPGLIDGLNRNREVYSLIVTGEGEKFFSAGADLKLFKDGDRTIARQMARRFGLAFESLTRFRGLSIAAINGYAMGGGLECALACDLRVSDDHAILALPEASVGLLPCAGGTQNLAWLVGEAWAKRLILCGEKLDAATALRIGLVDELCPKGSAKARALDWAAKAERQSPVSVAAAKKLIQAARYVPVSHALPEERELFVDLFDSHDQKEGVNAFLEKRKPNWKNA